MAWQEQQPPQTHTSQTQHCQTAALTVKVVLLRPLHRELGALGAHQDLNEVQRLGRNTWNEGGMSMRGVEHAAQASSAD